MLAYYCLPSKVLPPAYSPVALSLPCANIEGGVYRYIDDLHALTSRVSPQVIYPWTRYHTPIALEYLRPFLLSHPDQGAGIISNGLSHGFHVGFDHHRQQLRSSRHNHPSAYANPAVVDERLAAEVAAGRLLGPLTPQVAH